MIVYARLSCGPRWSRSPKAALAGLAFFVAAGACGSDRAAVETGPEVFSEPDADAGSCADRCSLDGRAVVKCSGQIEACALELACGGGRCLPPCAAAAAEGSSNGCEFYLQPPLLKSSNNLVQSCYAAYVVNTSTIPVDVALAYEGTALDISKSMYRTAPGEPTLVQHHGPIAPGDGVILFVSDRPLRPDRPSAENLRYAGCPFGVTPAHLYDYYPKGTQFGSSFHLSANAPVSAATIFPFGGAWTQIPSATLLLPVSMWSKENILINAWGLGRSYPPGAQIMASEDDTDVTILPKNDIQDGIGVVGSAAGVPATYRLQKGQFLQLVQPQELTGSFVTSTKPTSIIGAHVCGNVPADVLNCDLMAAQIPAFALWGSEYVGVGYRPRLNDEHEPVPYRIVAARDGTRLDYDPEVPRGAPLELNAGETATFASGTGDAFVVRTQDAEHPIYVAAYMSGAGGDYWGSGRNFGGKGDPAFVNVVPAGQYLTTASFYADPTYGETSLVIVRAKADGEFKDVRLECLGGPVTGFASIGTRGDYEFARVDISSAGLPGAKSGDKACFYGTHHLRSEGPFTATLWGWDTTASYAIPSGMAARKLVSTPLVTR
ncbi:MAG: hypothetical protein BGO98_35700 [Myxococcales bacterium 68-20]|nr:IgGFc-binding protein [Myxococcales bacterium]OJY25941.1 MAG: hypothetical protein BGO98_35700 [Myxococcales bacterium 68-20]